MCACQICIWSLYLGERPLRTFGCLGCSRDRAQTMCVYPCSGSYKTLCSEVHRARALICADLECSVSVFRLTGCCSESHSLVCHQTTPLASTDACKHQSERSRPCLVAGPPSHPHFPTRLSSPLAQPVHPRPATEEMRRITPAFAHETPKDTIASWAKRSMCMVPSVLGSHSSGPGWRYIPSAQADLAALCTTTEAEHAHVL